MAKNTTIGWCHHTHNFWSGCEKVSPGCRDCYAEAHDKRFAAGAHWGKDAPRRFYDDEHWKQPYRWNRAAEKRGVRERVFTLSTGDFFEDRPDLIEVRQRAWGVIADTPWLDWLIVTKRPENIPAMLPRMTYRGLHGTALAWRVSPWPNVWLGTTCEDQPHAVKRLPLLLAVTPRPPVFFCSYEPALGAIDFRRLEIDPVGYPGLHASALDAQRDGNALELPHKLDWIIIGCESGRRARPAELAWFTGVRDQCAETGTPLFVKQATGLDELRGGEIITRIGIGPGTSVHGKAGRLSILAAPYLDGQQYTQFPRDQYGEKYDA